MTLHSQWGRLPKKMLSQIKDVFFIYSIINLILWLNSISELNLTEQFLRNIDTFYVITDKNSV